MITCIGQGFIQGYQQLNAFLLRHQRWLWLLSVGIGSCLFILNSYADVGGGNDLLQTSVGDATSTVFGSGKKFLYIFEFIFAAASYIKTKNVMVLFGVVAIAIFINLVIHFMNIQVNVG